MSHFQETPMQKNYHASQLAGITEYGGMKATDSMSMQSM